MAWHKKRWLRTRGNVRHVLSGIYAKFPMAMYFCNVITSAKRWSTTTSTTTAMKHYFLFGSPLFFFFIVFVF